MEEEEEERVEKEVEEEERVEKEEVVESKRSAMGKGESA